MTGNQRRRKPPAKWAPKKVQTEDGEELSRSEWLLQKTVEGVEKLTTEGGWKAFLDFKAKFPRRSFGNVLLILQQDPSATFVAGYSDWTKKHKRKVLSQAEGGQPLYYWAPHKVWITQENEKTGKEERVQVTRFHPTHGFDIKSTVGPPIPERPKLTTLDGEAPQALWDGMAGWLTQQGYDVALEDIKGREQGYTTPDKRVRVDSKLSSLARYAVLLHEGAGHIANGHLDDDYSLYVSHRGRYETEAEATAYIVATSLGLDLGTTSFEYIAGWSRANPELVEEVGDKVCKTADAVLDAIAPELGTALEIEQGSGLEAELPDMPS